MEPETFPDPLRGAASSVLRAGLTNAMQVGYAVASASQVIAFRRKAQGRAVAERDERARRAISTQIRAERDEARAGWAPALDRPWLAQADIISAARVWGAAMPYADRGVPWYEPTAAGAMRACEERLRELHPYAMAYYDRLREERSAPAEAMRAAAPLFARAPRAQDTPFSARAVLGAGDGVAASRAPGEEVVAIPGGGPGEAERMEQRGRLTADALQQQAVAAGGDPFTSAGLAALLETVTSLPPELIERIARAGGVDGPAPGEPRRAGGGSVQIPDLGRAADLAEVPGRDSRAEVMAGARHAGGTAAAAEVSGRRQWRDEFPVPIKEVVASAASAGTGADRRAAGSNRPSARRGSGPGGTGRS